MKIKVVVFDVGQTLSNQLDKERLFDRNKSYYAYVYQELIKRNFSSHLPNLQSYDSHQFVEDLNTFNRATRTEKNESIEVLKEYRMAEQTLDILLSYESSKGSNIPRPSVYDVLIPQLDEIYAGTEALVEGVYELWPDTRSTLEDLKQKGYILCLASNTAHPVKHEHMLSRLGITPFIDYFAISSYIGVRKPNPEMLKFLMNKTGVSADEMIIVGDLLDRDVLMGNAAGVRSVWINAIPYNLEQNLKRIAEGDKKYLPTEGIVCLAQLSPTIDYMNNVVPDKDQISVGYYFPHIRKKLETGKQGAFVNSQKIRYMPIELRSPIENLGKFDVIVHKITDLILSDREEDRQAVENLRQYISNNPSVLLLDPLEGLEYTNNRRSFLNLWTPVTVKGVNVRSPAVYTENYRFPCVLKTEIACQVKGSHDMVVVMNESCLKTGASKFSIPFIAQEWISHSSMFKIYILGEVYKVSPQKVVKTNEELYHFNSAKMPDNFIVNQDIKVDEEVIQEINSRLKSLTGLGMISYDLAIEDTTGDYVLIDLNYFPGYYTLHDYKTQMDNYILQSYCRFKNNI